MHPPGTHRALAPTATGDSVMAAAAPVSGSVRCRQEDEGTSNFTTFIITSSHALGGGWGAGGKATNKQKKEN